MIIKAPQDFSKATYPIVFLAGSVEMGAAVDWQDSTAATLSKEGFTVLSPRRDDFDASQEQSIRNDYFHRQVEWELVGLEICDYILMYFAPNTKSPITLLELGLFCEPEKMVVCCPAGFWRKGNVDIVCERYGILRCETLEEAIAEILRRSQAA